MATSNPQPAPQQSTSDSVIDARIGRLLQIGVFTSAAVVFAGGCLYLIQQGHTRVHFHTFHNQPAYLKSIPSICAAAIHGDAVAIIQLGLLLLIATPIARVIFSIVAFALQKDFLYVAISSFVFLVLLYGLIWH
jgi:uncharacterized membrane protein